MASRGILVEHLWLNEPISVEIGEQIRIEQAGGRIDLDSYDLVLWWPSSFQDPRERLGAHYYKTGEEYTSRAWQVLEEGLLTGVSSLLNSYESSCRAANKLVSTLAAKQLAIPVPRTLFGNAGNCVASWDEPVVVKAITDTVNIDEERRLHTTDIAAVSLGSDDPEFPVIYQERIELQCEMRAYYFDGVSETVVLRQKAGGKFQSDIRLCKPDEITVDIVEDVRDSEIVTNYNAMLAGALNLRMFCSDYLIARSGKTYLIDVNPHGSWHWLAEPVRAALDEKFVEMVRRIAAHR